MATSKTCAECGHTHHFDEINDDQNMSPKLKLDELVSLSGRPNVFFRVRQMKHLTLVLEKA